MTVIGGIGHQVSTIVASTAAPVGVVLSNGAGPACIGATPVSTSSTAGAGIGMGPWAPRVEPEPRLRAEQWIRSSPRCTTHGSTDDVGDRVECSHLMEVDLVDRGAVHPSFGLGEALETAVAMVRTPASS